MKRTVVFYGPVRGKTNRVGGGEAGNERTISILNKSLDCEVILVPKSYGKGRGLWVLMIYVLGTLYNIVRTAVILLLSAKKKILHVSGFYGKSVYVEFIFVLIGYIFAEKVVYEVRAGGAQDYYYSGSNVYRWFFRKTISLTNSVLSQGRQQIEFIKSLSSRPKVIYYPNFVSDDEFGDVRQLEGGSNIIKIVYFGRLAPEKGVDIILEVIKNMKHRVCLELIGAISSEYKKDLLVDIENHDLHQLVKISPPMTRMELREYLDNFHFFIFPTREPREGHSNSLNEAMARGVVPVASDWGFNKDVIGDNDLIVSDFSSSQFSQRINMIWNEGLWKEKSANVKNRVATLFSEKAARESLLNAYQD